MLTTFTADLYVQYFRDLSDASTAGPPTAAETAAIMIRYATEVFSHPQRPERTSLFALQQKHSVPGFDVTRRLRGFRTGIREGASTGCAHPRRGPHT
jgi:hypothetical protein